MKRLILIIVVLAIAGFAAYRIMGKKSGEPKADKPKPLSMGVNPGSFNASFNTMLNAYFAVKDALVESDTLKANIAAAQLAKAADSLKVDEIAGDSTGMIKETAKSFSGTITGSALGLAGEKNIEDKRKEFDMISDALWSLTRTVKYEGQKVYYQFCPMAFENKGAYWLSKEANIRNPYFGNKMLTCGSTQDSLEYKR
jgi:Cu(I)/Ag(I) efflux system membrane fusion protein